MGHPGPGPAHLLLLAIHPLIHNPGVDDEIMIPHLPTIIQTQYTIEAWVRPSRAGPMNIVVRSDENYPQERAA